MSSVLVYTLVAVITGLILWGLLGIVVYRKWKEKKAPWVLGAVLVGFLLFLWQRKKPLMILLNSLLQFATALLAFLKITRPFVDKTSIRFPKAKEKPDSSAI